MRRLSTAEVEASGLQINSWKESSIGESVLYLDMLVLSEPGLFRNSTSSASRSSAFYRSICSSVLTINLETRILQLRTSKTASRAFLFRFLAISNGYDFNLLPVPGITDILCCLCSVSVVSIDLDPPNFLYLRSCSFLESFFFE